MKESMLYSICVEASLGDPPTEHTTNDAEGGNFMIKDKLDLRIEWKLQTSCSES